MSNRILAAEDSPTQAAMLCAHLQEAGFDVTLASDGAHALDLLDRESFDLVLSDVVMPDVDGYELCRLVKERDPKVPVVLLTSMNDPLDVVNALSAGADNFLRKPYQPDELIHRVRNMLHNKQLRDSGRTQMGLELFFLGRRFMINADREQILDLLVSTFEDLVDVNRRLRSREDELAQAHSDLVTRLAETTLERDRLDTVLAAVPAPIAVLDADGVVVKANTALTELAGVAPNSLQGTLVWESIRFVDSNGDPVERQQRALYSSLCMAQGATLGTSFDLFVATPEEHIPVVARSQPILDRNGRVLGAVGTMEDLRELMAHDPVTALPGHKILVETLRATAQASSRHGSLTGVLAITIDRYARLRENLGGGIDDVVAATVSKLRRQLTSRDITHRIPTTVPAYLGNGEVVIILGEVQSEADAIAVAQLLTAGLAGPVRAAGFKLEVTVSAAIGMCSSECDPATLVASTTAAARKVSSDGGGRVATSDTALEARVVDLLHKEAELRTAIAAGQLVTHYQPQIDVRDGRPVAVEALVRWQHPDRGLLGAGEIIPLAVESGLIAEVSWYVMEQACSQVAAWRQTLPGGTDMVLSVNVDTEQLAQPDMVCHVKRILADSALPPTALVLEITEGSVMHDPEAASQQLEALKALGVQVAVDDFGTGYSSLLQLRRLPIDVLKIDRRFVAGMIEDPADGAIVAGTVRLARTLGMGLVAEGVETEEQLVQLRILGCDHGQGYLWAKPMGAEDLSAWWPEHAAAPLFEGTAEPTSQLDTDDRQDEAISYLVHELRTPLAAITGYAGMLDRGPDAVAQFTDAILRNAWELEDRLAALSVSMDVLRGGLTIKTERTDTSELVRILGADLEDQLAPHPIRVSVHSSAVADIDSGKVGQAISNLLTNAAKFGPGDSPIELRVGAQDGLAVISVRDYGPGIPEHRRHELFRRFSRLGSTAPGMGIGLYLARSIIEAHGGVISYEPAPGGGALFHIKLPLAQGR